MCCVSVCGEMMIIEKLGMISEGENDFLETER